MEQSTQRLTARAVFVLYALLIAWLSLQPGSDTPPVINDKLAHLLAYGGFALLGLALGLRQGHYLFLCLLIVLYGGLMELGQSFVPRRDMSVLDMLANTAGVVLGYMVARFWQLDSADDAR